MCDRMRVGGAGTAVVCWEGLIVYGEGSWNDILFESFRVGDF